MSDRQFESAAAIGTGMMGPGIAVSLALGGVRATIVSRSEDGANQGLAKVREQVHLLRQNGLASPEAAAWALENVDAATDFDGVIRRVDLVCESAPEDMKLKQEMFERMDAIARPEAILTTNTSGLSITEVASRCKRPERVLTAHFWNPPHLMRLVELVRGEKTAEEAVNAVKGLLERCGKAVVVLKKDRPGQLGNRLQLAMMREAVHIVNEGIADAGDVDLAASQGFGLRLPVYGIFEHMDAVGLDMGLAIMDYIAQDLYGKPHAPDILREKVSKGELGAKTGKGFYDWRQKDFDAVKARRDRFVLEFLKSEFGKGKDR